MEGEDENPREPDHTTKYGYEDRETLSPPGILTLSLVGDSSIN